MANEQDKNPTTGAESDISKAQSQQQPQDKAGQRAETGEEAGQFETGQAGASPDEGLQGETAIKQRTDVEGGSPESEERGEAESGFVGSEGREDTSSELVEDEELKKDEGAPDTAE